jgi:hypothetical protein
MSVFEYMVVGLLGGIWFSAMMCNRSLALIERQIRPPFSPPVAHATEKPSHSD